MGVILVLQYSYMPVSNPCRPLSGDAEKNVLSADAVLLAAADAVANATMKLMASDQAQPQLRDQRRDGSVVWDEFTSL